MKQRFTFVDLVTVLALLLLALLFALLARPAAIGAPGVTKQCSIRPTVVLEGGARQAVTKYYVTATAKDAGRADNEVRRYALGEFRAHDQAIDACMDWVRCSTEK